MFTSETSDKKSHIFAYIQLTGLENGDSHSEDNSSSFVRQLGKILMPFTETWEISYIEQREKGFFVQFKREIDVLDFSLSFLEKMKKLLIHLD